MSRQKKEYLFNSEDTAFEVSTADHIVGRVESEIYDSFLPLYNIKYKDVIESSMKDNLFDGLSVELKVKRDVYESLKSALINKKTVMIRRTKVDVFNEDKIAFLNKLEYGMDSKETTFILYFGSFEDYVLNLQQTAPTVVYPLFELYEEPYNYNKVWFNGDIGSFIDEVYDFNLFNSRYVNTPYEGSFLEFAEARKSRTIIQNIQKVNLEQKTINANWEKKSMKEIIKQAFENANFYPKLKTKMVSDKYPNGKQIQISYELEQEKILDTSEYGVLSYKEKLDITEVIIDSHKLSNLIVADDTTNIAIQTTTSATINDGFNNLQGYQYKYFKPPFLASSESILESSDYYFPNWVDDNAKDCFRDLNDKRAKVVKTIEIDFIDLLYFKDIKCGMKLVFDDPIIGKEKFRINQISEIFSGDTNYLTFFMDELENLYEE